MRIEEINDLSFDEEVLQSERPVLVDFGADWCAPCRQQEPILEKLAAEREDVRFVRMNIDASPLTAMAYGVRGVPTVVLFRGGEPAQRGLGLQSPRHLKEMLGE